VALEPPGSQERLFSVWFVGSSVAGTLLEACYLGHATWGMLLGACYLRHAS
jgi:hypothetical protein